MEVGFVWEGRGRDGSRFLFLCTTPDPHSPPCMTPALQGVNDLISSVPYLLILSDMCLRLGARHVPGPLNLMRFLKKQGTP